MNFSLTIACLLALLNPNAAFQSIGLPGISRQMPNGLANEGCGIRKSTRANAEAAKTSSKSSSGVNGASASDVEQLKRTLVREYNSFFSPMEREFYANDVTFEDPMTSLEGIDSYERNVDMLSGKNIMGSILFRDAGIVLHNIEGGEIQPDGSINDILTRWTLRFTFKILPWQPTARFSGVSVYKVRPGGPKGVQILKQNDFWDSINLVKGGTYQQVPKSTAVSDFVNQLKTENFAAPSAGAELPYQLLRRGADYEVRRYPSFVAVQTNYERRDLGFSELGAFCSGMKPLAPAVMNIASDSSSDQSKTMMWPLAFAPPGSDAPPKMTAAAEKAKQDQWKDCDIIVMPERVVAVGSFSDASIEPVVKRADTLLRQACDRDGLKVAATSALSFAQYDAIFSMGKRRGEVWLELEKGNPWSKAL